MDTAPRRPGCARAPRELKPVGEALRIQRRFRHLTDVESQERQSRVNGQWKQLLEVDGKRLPF